jgi:hypothetical protein
LSDFSIVQTLGRFSAHERGLQFGAAFTPRSVEAHLPKDDLAALKCALAPVIADLNRDRAAHVTRADRFLARAVPAAAMAGLVLGWGISGDIRLGLFLAALLGAAALFVLFGLAQDEPRRITRHDIIDVLARHLMGFRVDPAPVIATEEIDALRLFAPVRKVSVDLCLTGLRDDRLVVVSRIGLMFGYDGNRSQKQGDGLTFVMVEIALPETAQADGITTIMAKDASRIAILAQKLMHRDSAVPTGDPGFDSRYHVTGDVAPVTPALRAGFARLEAEARSGPTGLTEVPAGQGLRPWVVILPGKLVVLTPLAMFDGAFEPPPYWRPIDPDTLIPAFASDLAILNGHINAALSLPIGDIT